MGAKAPATMPFPYVVSAGPPAFVELGEILQLLNEDRARCGLPPKNRWWARRVCEMMGIRFLQKAPGCKLMATGRDLRSSGFWDALEHHRQRQRSDDEEDGAGVG